MTTEPETLCRCGCGKPTSRMFAPGHDQRAIHEIIARYGGVEEFLRIHGA